MAPMYTRAYLKENGYHCVLGAKCDLLVPNAQGERIVKDIQEFVRAHTAAELKLKCEVGGMSKTGTKFELALRLYKAGAMWEPVGDAAEKAAIDSEVEALERKHTLVQLREMCDQACVSSVGNKRGLATRLVRPKYSTGPTF